MLPAKVGAVRDASASEGASDRHFRLPGQLFQLTNFGGDFHMTSICVRAQVSSTELCADAQSVAALCRGIMPGMGKPASQREEEYRREVQNYLRALDIGRGWNQSEIARQAGLKPSNINKAIKGTQSLGLEYLLVLEEQSGIPLPEGLLAAAKGRRSQGHASPEEVQAFLNSSPAWRQMIALGQQLAATEDPAEKAEIQKQIQELASKVA